MKYRLFIVFSVLALCGCTAEMVEKHGDSIQLLSHDPTHPPKGGVMKYLNTGKDSWRKARRADAEKQMERYCAGPYKITAEGPRSKFGSAMPIGNSVSVEVDQYTYIAFECEKRGVLK
jgi:hypothetical protein